MDQQLFNCLVGSLSPQLEVRSAAEEGLKQLMTSQDAGLSLSRLTLTQDADLSIRQLAGVLLQKYIKQYWSAVFNEFVGPMLGEDIKQRIRELLLSGLTDPARKIRTAIAFALSSIAHSDYPTSFPSLIPTIINLLQSGNPDAVHGAMRVLEEFVRGDLGEDQMLGVCRDLMPVLEGVVGDEKNSPLSRASAISILRQVLRTLYMLKDEYPEQVETSVKDVLPRWLEVMGRVLGGKAEMELTGDWEGLKVRNEIFRTMTTITHSFPRSLNQSLRFYLTNATTTLHALYPTFQTHYLSSSPDAPEPPSCISSSGGDSNPDSNDIGIPELACSIVDYLTGAARARGAKEVFVIGGDGGKGKGKGKGKEGKELPSQEMLGLVDALLRFTQMTREDEENWSSDPNAFVADEDDEAEAYSLRSAGHDLLGSMLDKYPAATAVALQIAVSQRIAESSQMRDRGDEGWWKPLEGALACVGAVADDLQELLEEERESGMLSSFDLQTLFDNVVPQLLSMTEQPFLQGRAFVFASQYVNSLQGEMSRQYLEAAVHVLEAPGIGVPVKVSAVKTIRNFCRYISAEILAPFSLRIISDLVPFLAQATEETLALVLEAIRAVIGVDGNVLNGIVTAQLVDVIYDVWLKNNDDPFLTAIVQETYETIAGVVFSNDEVYMALVEHAIPKLAVAIAEPVTEETLSLPAAAFELVESILRGRRGGLGKAIGELLWPSAFKCLVTSDDMDSMQYGCVCLTLFVRKDAEHLMQWRDTDGETGLDKVLALLARLLDPSFSESGGLFMGDLIIHLLRNAGGHLSAVLPQLLHALVSRIVVASTPSYISTLVLPFAYLFTAHRDSVLELLEGMQVESKQSPTGSESGLAVVLRAWCNDAIDTVQGSWSIKVNNMAMVDLFLSQRPSLQHVAVRGEMVITDENRNVIMTRSRTRSHPHEFAQISFPTRALKYMLNEIQNAENAGDTEGGDGLGIAADDGDDSWSDDDPLAKEQELGAYLSDFMGGGISGWKDDEEVAQDEDEDLANDPITQINVQQRMVSVIREAYANNTNNIHGMIEHLSDVEKAVLQKVLTL